LLLGRKDLIEAANWSNSPRDETVGRGMKVAKEQIIGMVAAVDWILEQSEEGLQAEFRRRAERIAAQLKGIPGVSHEIFVPPLANAIPHLLIRYDHTRAGQGAAGDRRAFAAWHTRHRTKPLDWAQIRIGGLAGRHQRHCGRGVDVATGRGEDRGRQIARSADGLKNRHLAGSPFGP
jgi:L-seryl-tRNA(Ser) seleniumtransferase